MSRTYREDGGGIAALRAIPAFQKSNESSRIQNTQSTDRLQRLGSSQKQSVRPTAKNNELVDPAARLPFPSAQQVAQNELLSTTVFPDVQDETAQDESGDPEELQKNDPLGTQIWKLYSRTKTRLPNQERMENLTWRMMAMNLKKREREQALCVWRRLVENVTNLCIELLKLREERLLRNRPGQVVLLCNYEVLLIEVSARLEMILWISMITLFPVLWLHQQQPSLRLLWIMSARRHNILQLYPSQDGADKQWHQQHLCQNICMSKRTLANSTTYNEEFARRA